MTTISQLSAALGGSYRIERELGAGGMASVFLATDLKHSRLVAVKVLKPELAAVLGTERFLQEIRIAAGLDHPHILTLIDSGAAEGLLYYVLPYVRGESLREKLMREKQLGIDEAIGIARQVGSALEYAHREGVVHRDIKPENILLQEGEAMLADFGIALAVREAGGNRLTETGTSLGTPEYMSPEQATGDRSLDARSDVYSLGAVVYEMLTGDPPHTGSTVQAVIAKLLTERPTSVRVLRDTVPEGVDRAVAKALAKVPADRYRSAGEFVAALGTGAAAPSIAGRGGARMPRIVLRAALALGTLAALIVWLGRHRVAPASAPAPASYDRVQLTTSGHASAPTISPDGSEIAYVEQTCADTGTCHASVTVRDLASGAERVIVDDIGWGFPAAFSPDGAWVLIDGIAVGPGQPAGQYVVPRLGGPLVYAGAGRGDFLPTGDSVLIASATTGASSVQFRAIALPVTQPADSAAKISRGKLGEIDDVRVAPDGRWVAVVWERFGGSDIVALYDRTGVLRDSVAVPPSAPFTLQWAPGSGAVLAYVVSRRGEGGLVRIAVSLSGAFGPRDTLIVTPGVRGATAFTVSTISHALAYRVSQPGENLLWTLSQQPAEAPPRPVRRVLSSSAAVSASLTRDGRTVVFGAVVPATGAPQTRVFAAPFDSGETRALTPPLPDVFTWNPTLDGRRVIVETTRPGGGARLTAYDVVAARASPFTDVPIRGPLTESGRGGVALLDAASGTLRLFDAAGHDRAHLVIPDSLGYVYALVSSPDASEFAFLAVRPDTESGESAARQAFYRISATGKVKLITWFDFGNELLDPFQWTADGWIHFGALAAGTNRPMLWRVRASGGVAKPVSALPFAPDACVCTMSSDGAHWAGVVSHALSDIYLIRNFDADRR